MRVLGIAAIFCALIMKLGGQESFQRESYPKIKRSWVKDYQLNSGRQTVAIPMDNGNNWNAELSFGNIEHGKKVPLIIALHWAGQEGTQKEFAQCLAFPGLEHLNGIIIAPSAEGGHWVSESLECRVIDLIRKVRKYWPIDEEKILITGYSNGGIGTWHYVSRHPKLFTSGIAMAGSYRVTKLKKPIYIIHGEQDDLFRLSDISSVIKASKEKGSSIELTVIPEFSHYMACAYKDKLEAISKELVGF